MAVKINREAPAGSKEAPWTTFLFWWTQAAVTAFLGGEVKAASIAQFSRRTASFVDGTNRAIAALVL